jgi:3-dehydroquinate synthase
MNQNVKVKTFSESGSYEISIGDGLLAGCGEWARGCLPGGTGKLLIVSNQKVFGLYGGKVRKSLEKAGFKPTVWLMRDGERHKNFRSLQQLLSFLSEQKFTRIDAVVALGGGVVGDLAGFAAAVYLRGIPVLQIPTTLLAQIDSSVGGKAAVNTRHGKNLIGAFYQPSGVLIDIDTLQTLPRRELTAGFCEAVKQGAVAGRKLFGQTKLFLETYPVKGFSRYFQANKNDEFKPALVSLIKAQVSFKAAIVAGDQKESLARKDARSRKILNFGHTIGHALEKAAGYRKLKHGEAVGYGMLAAAELAKNLDILDKNSLNLLSDVVHLAGELPKLRGIESDKIIRALAFDKKKAGENITWILLKKIGLPVLVGDNEIPISMVKRSIKTILK